MMDLTPRDVDECVRLAEAAEQQIRDELDENLPNMPAVRTGILHAFLMIILDENQCTEFEVKLTEKWPDIGGPLADPALNPETDR